MLFSIAVQLTLFGIVIGVALAVFYLYTIRDLAREGNALFGQRCAYVNPKLIAYKNAFLRYAEYLNTTPYAEMDADVMWEYLDEYTALVREYIPEEERWLARQRSFLNRWDFQLVEPWYIKEAAELQWQMYQAYRDDAADILNTFNYPELALHIPFGYVSEARQRRDDSRNRYFAFYEEASSIDDWRKHLADVPVPDACTPENTIIPDTSGSVDWERFGSDESTPSGEPIDPSYISVPLNPARRSVAYIR